MEIWEDISGYEGLYQVSSYGNVKSLKFKNERIMSLSVNSDGYYQVGLMLDGKQIYHKVHRLVALAFIENVENKPQVNHKDTNKKNNHVSNLEWATRKENINHAHENNLINRKGALNGKSQLGENDVLIIRNRKHNGENRANVYVDYKDRISLSGFKKIWHNQNWKHIKIGE